MKLLQKMIHMLRARSGSLIAELMLTLELQRTMPNPPLGHRIPSQLVYLRQFNVEIAYDFVRDRRNTAEVQALPILCVPQSGQQRLRTQ